MLAFQKQKLKMKISNENRQKAKWMNQKEKHGRTHEAQNKLLHICNKPLYALEKHPVVKTIKQVGCIHGQHKPLTLCLRNRNVVAVKEGMK